MKKAKKRRKKGGREGLVDGETSVQGERKKNPKKERK